MAENLSPESILQEALEISEFQDRVAYLDTVCGEDQALRSEIESLLEAHFAAEAFMDTQVEPGWREALKEGDSELPGSASIPSIEELESEFPELEIIELIGRGGMGAVFKARQESLDRLVALKVLPADWNRSGNFAERFEREAKTLAALNHPNIVTIYEFGERAGRFFFTMEYVDGTDLAHMIQSGEMPSEQALDLIPPICEAIQFAHDGGVVHRDIKPGNILVGRDGRVKVADFGLAKLGKSLELESESGAAVDQQSDLTAPRGVLGTPRYMAPEQATGSGEVDHRADLYALGVVFYEMLVGEPPAKGELVIPPSQQGDVDSRWDRVVMHALEEDPERRYQHATEIKTAVESVLAEQKKRGSGWLKAAAVVGFASVAVGAVLMWPKDDPEVEGRLVNSLEMEFVAVPGVGGLVSVWETRVKDYEVFVEETGRSWTSPPFEQTPDHPAVHVSWHDARAFCRWLTEREQKAGLLEEGEVYRLPTDREWSAMAHLTDEEGNDPEERQLSQGTVYPWGEEGPVPDGAGNYPDATGRDGISSAAVQGYEDHFAATAPVGTFEPTKEGLHDLGGNVWEWTASSFSPEDARPVMRGGSWWASEADDGWQSLLASYRRADVEATEPEEWDVGFRVVRGPEATEEKRDDLFRLVLKGDLEGVSKAIADGADVNAANAAGQPAIVLAAETGNLAMVKLLHEQHDAKLNRSDRRGRSPLHAAAEIGHSELVTWLLEQGADARARTIAGQQPFLLAVSRAPLGLLEDLLAAAGPEALTNADSKEVDPLARACLSGSDETVRWIIEQLDAVQMREAASHWIPTNAMLLAPLESSLMSAFLAKASGRLTAKTLGSGLLATVNFDKEENFSLLLEAVGEEGLDQEAMEGLGVTAVGRGRPWAIKELVSRGWNLKEYDNKEGKSVLLLAVTSSGEAREFLRQFSEMLEAQGNDWAQKYLARMLAQMPPPATRETIRLLAEAGADLEARNENEWTPLIAAAFRGNFEALETLLDLGAEIEAKDDAEFTPLLCAVEQGHLEIVKELDRRGADFETVNLYGQGVLHNAHRHDEVLRYLLAKGVPVDAKDKEGRTPLVNLASEGDEGVIALLLEAGADVHAVPTGGKIGGATALHRACVVMGEKEKAEYMQNVKTRAALGGPNVGALVEPVGKDERLRAIKLLVEAGADPSAKDEEWMTPLHFAAKSGLSEAVEFFLARGADPNGLTAIFNGPLHLAAMGGQLECAQVLVEHGAVTDSPVWPFPLANTAVAGGNPELLVYLLRMKAPIDRQDPYGAYPIHHAANVGPVEMVEILLDAGADLNARDKAWWTPAHQAAGTNQREIVDLLWKRGARMNARDLFSITPAQAAARNGHTALSVHLEELAKNPVARPEPVKTEASSQQ